MNTENIPFFTAVACQRETTQIITMSAGRCDRFTHQPHQRQPFSDIGSQPLWCASIVLLIKSVLPTQHETRDYYMSKVGGENENGVSSQMSPGSNRQMNETNN